MRVEISFPTIYIIYTQTRRRELVLSCGGLETFL